MAKTKVYYKCELRPQGCIDLSCGRMDVIRREFHPKKQEYIEACIHGQSPRIEPSSGKEHRNEMNDPIVRLIARLHLAYRVVNGSPNGMLAFYLRS